MNVVMIVVSFRFFLFKIIHLPFCASHFNLLFLISGSRISLISKKNIRYEGTLYSINESDATVALQNVKSYGTEGREKTQEGCTFVPPQDAVHPYLLFRGCDIKDLHVHEKQETETQPKEETQSKKLEEPNKNSEAKKSGDTKKSSKQQRPRQSKSKAQVGTGASLLNRKERGTVEGGMLSSSFTLSIASTWGSYHRSLLKYF